MGKYEVFLRQSVLKKDFGRIPKTDLRRIIEVIRSLSDNPRPAGAKKLSAQERYRVRQGDYRVIYSIQDAEHTVWVVKVGHRKDVYR